MDWGRCIYHPEADSNFLVAARDPVTGDEFDVVSCSECDLARTEPQPSSVDLDRYYPTSYHGATKRYLFGLDRVLGLVHRSRIQRIETIVGGPGSVLDVGCGPGWFLAHMRERGWQTRGTERSEDAARRAREAQALDVRAQELGELIAEGATFDAVVLWHVAEHLRDPAGTLRDIACLLRPGGVAMISVPNFGSPEAKFGGAGWFHLDVPRHLYHFSEMTLKRLIAEAGLVPVAESHIAPEYDVFSFVQTFENRIGFPPNLLYDVLRRREARLAHPSMRSVASFACVAAAAPLTIVGFVWATLAAKMGKGATMTFFAQRSPESQLS